MIFGRAQSTVLGGAWHTCFSSAATADHESSVKLTFWISISRMSAVHVSCWGTMRGPQPVSPSCFYLSQAPLNTISSTSCTNKEAFFTQERKTLHLFAWHATFVQAVVAQADGVADEWSFGLAISSRLLH
jgi:hypothetical protein